MLRKHPQQIAWLTVFTGLFFFCLSCSAFGYGVYYFLFQSPVPLSVRLVVSRGSVKLTTLDNTDPLVDNQISIDPQTYIDVRDDSQAILYFQDSYSRQTVTTITLTTGTKLFVAEANRPRFDFSRRPYRIDLSRADGQMIVTASPDGRDFLLDIRSDLGVARIMDDGRYTINTEYYPETRLRRLNLFNQGGRANLYKSSMNEWKEVNPNRIAHLMLNNGGTPDFEPESDSPLVILAEGRFLTEDTATRADQFPDNWKCQSLPEPGSDEPVAEQFRDQSENYALHFRRLGENRVHHAEAYCFWEKSDLTGIDLTPYNTLRLQARMQINEHDLPLCGIAGSECPVMLEIEYYVMQKGGKLQTVNDVPVKYKWNHGFYVVPDPSKPPSCGTCRLAHERINARVWYFYDSGDLWAQLVDPSSGDIPVIRSITVSGSGHQWDSMVSEVTLLGTPRN